MRSSLSQDRAASMERLRTTLLRMTRDPSTAVRSCKALTVTADKRVFVIAGPNGAGKTTFATEFLPNEAGCPIFVNADLIAAGLSPFRSSLVAVQAAKLMLRQIEEHAQRGPELRLRDDTERTRSCAPDSPLAGTGLSGQAVLPAPARPRGSEQACRRPACVGRRPRRSRTGD